VDDFSAKLNYIVHKQRTSFSPETSLVIKDLVNDANGQDQGKDFFSQIQEHKHFPMPTSRPSGQLRQLLLRAKICIAVTKTDYAYLIKHNAKETICGAFGVQY